MIEQCVIIGGGIASLSAAIHLAERGVKALLIEGGGYPCHRICGEFLSPEALPILSKWQISVPAKTKHCSIFYKNKQIDLTLPSQAGNCSRYTLDKNLADHAMKLGVKVMCETSVTSILTSERDDPHIINLSDGHIITAQQLIIGTGKLPKNSQEQIPDMKYIGLKAHFSGIKLHNQLEMHSFPGGYLGMVNVDEQTTNIACIIKKSIVPPSFSWEQIFNTYIMKNCSSQLNIRMKNSQMLFPNWLGGYVPEFGIRKHPTWKRAFWVGDAAGSIPPISGNGLSIALNSGKMAAEFALRNDWKGFEIAWRKHYQQRFFWAKLLHQAFLNPYVISVGFPMANKIPSIPQFFWNKTRESS